MARVVMILGNTMFYGGTEAFIMNYYRHINHNAVCGGNFKKHNSIPVAAPYTKYFMK